MLVRRDVAAEQRQAGIAVALFEIAKHLIVGAVLFHDEEDVGDRRALADFRRNHRRRRGFRVLQQRVVISRVVVHLFRIARQAARVRRVDERNQAIHLVAVMLKADRRRRLIDRPFDQIGSGPVAFATADDDAFAVGGRHDQRWIPAGGEKPERPALLAILDVDHRDGIVVGVRDVEPLAVRGQRQRIRRAAGRRLRTERRADHLEPLSRFEVECDDVVGVAARHEEAAVRGDRDVVRMRVSGERS
jgi:hypothetical protein